MRRWQSQNTRNFLVSDFLKLSKAMTTKAEELANELRSLDSESAVAVGKLRERFSAGVLTLSFYIIGSEEDDFMLPATKRRQEMRPSGELYFIYVPSHIVLCIQCTLYRCFSFQQKYCQREKSNTEQESK